MNLGFGEILAIGLLALLIFGPRKLPELARQFGKAMAEFKRASNEFKGQFDVEMRRMEVEETLRKENEALKRALQVPENSVAQTPTEPELTVAPDPIPTDPKGPNA